MPGPASPRQSQPRYETPKHPLDALELSLLSARMIGRGTCAYALIASSQCRLGTALLERTFSRAFTFSRTAWGLVLSP